MAQKLLITLFLLFFLSCSHFQETEGNFFKGEIVHVEIEGGFYGIITDKGERLDPINLPDAFKSDGLLVNGKYILQRDVHSLRMWGKTVSLIRIRKDSPPSE